MVLLSREFIAVPDDKKNQIVFKWPDLKIRKFTRAIVNADELALFINTGQVIGTMGPGRHQIDAQELPFLGMFIDAATGGNAYRAELYFVGTREYPGFTFGGRIDDVQDPQTGMIVTLRVFGDYSLQVKDPTRAHHQPGRDRRRHQQRARGGLGQRPAPQGHAYRGDDPDRPQRVAHPGPVRLHAGPGEGVHRGRQQPARHLRRGPGPDGQLRRQLERGRRGPAEEPGQGHGLQPPGRRLQPLCGGRDGPRRRPGAWPRAAGATAVPSWPSVSGLGGQLAGGGGGPGVGGEPGPVPPPAPGFAGGGAGFAGAAGPGGAPAPAPVATVTCPSCNTTQTAGAKFCSSCGAALPPPAGHCSGCGTDNARRRPGSVPSAASPWAPSPSTALRAGPKPGPASASAPAAARPSRQRPRPRAPSAAARRQWGCRRRLTAMTTG